MKKHILLRAGCAGRNGLAGWAQPRFMIRERQSRPGIRPDRPEKSVGGQYDILYRRPAVLRGERELNRKIYTVVRSCRHETFLPQREGGVASDLPDIIDRMPKRKYLFRLDCAHMGRCDAVLFLMDGRVPDEGACFELGYCYVKGKR